MTIDLERAVEHIDNLDAFIKRLNGDASFADAPAEATDGIKKVGLYGIPEQVVVKSEAAVAAIFDALSGPSTVVGGHVAGGPPEWWGDTRRVAEHYRLPEGSTKAAFVDALAILDRYVRDDCFRLAGLAFLIGDLHIKIKTRPTPNVFAPPRKPNANGLVYIFDPEFDNNISATVYETLYKRIFVGEPCVAYLRAVLDEIELLD